MVAAFEFEVLGGFDLTTANEYFGGWTTEPPPGFAVQMAFPVEGWHTAAAVMVRQDSETRVSGQVYGAGRHAEMAWSQALAVLSLDEDGLGFAAVGRRDPVIGGLQRRHPGLRPVLFHSPYEAAAAFVIGHRITVQQGRLIRQRMAAEAGEQVTTPAGSVPAFPSPQALLELQSFPGIPAAKWPRLHGVARAALDGVLDRSRLRALPYEDALAQLRAIPGLGPFFSQGVLIRGAGLVDAVSDDAVTRQAVQKAYGLRTEPTPRRVLEIAEAWRPYRTWAMVLLHVWLRREAGGAGAGRQRTKGKA